MRQSLMGLLKRETDYTLKVFGELANELGLIDPKLYREIAAMPWPKRGSGKAKQGQRLKKRTKDSARTSHADAGRRDK